VLELLGAAYPYLRMQGLPLSDQISAQEVEEYLKDVKGSPEAWGVIRLIYDALQAMKEPYRRLPQAIGQILHRGREGWDKVETLGPRPRIQDAFMKEESRNGLKTRLAAAVRTATSGGRDALIWGERERGGSGYAVHPIFGNKIEVFPNKKLDFTDMNGVLSPINFEQEGLGSVRVLPL